MNHLLKVLQGETLQGCRVSPCRPPCRPCRRKGFTLIELLVVIAILGILSAGILTAINVTSNLDKAKLAKAKTFSKSLENSLSVSQVGKWSFEGNVNDTSGYGNNGTLQNGASISTNPCDLGFGKCLNLDGQNDYVDITGIHNSLVGVNRLSVFAWVKPTTSSVRQSIFSILVPPIAGTEYIQLTYSTENKIYVWLAPSGYAESRAYAEASNSSYTLVGGWHHVGFVWDGTNNINMYLDGNPIASSESARYGGGIDSLSFNFGLGVLASNIGIYNNNGSPFGGLIDEVQIYNQALTASQIHQLYAQGWVRHLLALR